MRQAGKRNEAIVEPTNAFTWMRAAVYLPTVRAGQVTGLFSTEGRSTA